MNKKIFVLVSVFLLLPAIYLNAQQGDSVVFKINGEPVYKSEVTRAYQKGRESEDSKKKQSTKDFVQSYIDFKLNVKEATVQGLDTTKSYKRDMSSYRGQLASTYMTDTVFDMEYTKKIYQRMLQNVEINHIMLPFDREVVLPADTAAVYAKALEARNKILKNGFNLKDLNLKKSIQRFSPNVEDNNGYVGWIAPFMVSSLVEDIAYSLPEKEISMPIRSSKGYHIVEVLAKRPAIGSVEIEQVIFSFPLIPATQQVIDSVGSVAKREYAKISTAGDFQSLCDEFSKTFQTGDKGCYYGIIGLDSNLPSAFTAAAFNLKKPGDISEPIMTDYGFHIIRLIDKKPIPEFDQIKDALKERITKSDKARNLGKEARAKLLSTFDIKINQDAYSKLADITATLSPLDSMFLSKITNEGEILIDIEGKRGYSINEFSKYIRYRQKEYEGSDKEALLMTRTTSANNYSLSTDILKNFFDDFLMTVTTSYSEDTLEERFPEFREAMNDFSDGLLFFDIKNKNIWKRPQTEEAELAKIFNKNKKKYSLNGAKYKGIVIYAKNEHALLKAKAIAETVKDRELLIEKIKNSVNKDSILVKTESGLWNKGENPYIDNKIFEGNEPNPRRGYPYFFVTGKFIYKPEDYKDVKSEVELDYQEVLEKNWSDYLRNKYTVEVNKSILNTIK